jgi:hypothetical protein
MTEEDLSRNDVKDTITRRGCRFVILWAAGILLLYAVSGYFGVRTLLTYKVETEKVRHARIGSAMTEPDAQGSEIKSAPGAKPVDVLVGIYINSIGEFDLKESGWTADFDIWFRWTGDEVKPGNNFEVVNGHIEQREKKETYVAGREHYERYRVKARLAKFFDSSRFPFNDQGLSIEIEDSAHGAERLRFIADEQESGINRSGVLQSLKIMKSLMTVKLHSYGSRRGDPRASPNTAEVHSQFIYAILVIPPSTLVFIKLFQALFASVAIAFIVFFIKPTHVDPRFGLGVGALFAAVGNNIVVGTMLPPAGGITLAALVNTIGLVTIFLTLVQSTISLYILDTMGQDKLRLFFDKVSFVVFLIGYAGVNLMLPIVAG